MGFYTSDASGMYWNVKKGHFVNKSGEAHNGFEGRIIGVRLKEGVYNRQKTEQFQIKVKDGDQTVVLSMAAFYHNLRPESPSVPFRMVLQRLIPKRDGRELAKDEIVKIETWPYQFDTLEGSCIGIINGLGEKVEANGSISKKSPVATYRNAVDWLIKKYGTWTGGDAVLNTYNGEDDDMQQEDEPPAEEESDLPF